MRRPLLLLTLLAACGDDEAIPDAGGSHDASVDAMIAVDADPEMPLTLRDTGLYSDWDEETLADGVHAFSPEFILWTDGATKRRWIYLPPSTTIDTADMDYWAFPEGTKVWKEFTRDGIRVETRLLQKIGPETADWYYAAFAWNEEQTEAVAIPLGVIDALGTGHDIPSRSDCRKCHDRLPSRVLGFSAIQLDHAASNGEISLAEAISMSWLSAPPAVSGGAGSEYFPLPGDATAQAALGYLHSNCGNCHNPMSDISTVSVRWRLAVGGLATVNGTDAYVTAVGVPPTLPLTDATNIITAASPSTSSAYLRLTSSVLTVQMPPMGHEIVDTVGSQALSDWIDDL